MHPPILRCLVPGAMPAVGLTVEPGEIAPVPALLAIETLTAYLRSVDPARENSRTWSEFVIDSQIQDPGLRQRCEKALAGARAIFARRRTSWPTLTNPKPKLADAESEARKQEPSRFRLLATTHRGT